VHGYTRCMANVRRVWWVRYERMGIFWATPTRVNLEAVTGSKAVESIGVGQKHVVVSTDDSKWLAVDG